MSGSVRLEIHDRVGTIKIDNPDTKNALTADMTSDLFEHVVALRDNDQVGVVLVTGVGTDFCSGAHTGDIALGLAATPDERAGTFETGLRSAIHPLVKGFLALPQPVVVSVRGYAIGIGVSLVLAADLVVASDTAVFIVPQVKLGHTLDHGESWLLPRRIGLGRSLQMALLGERLRAADAERFGLVNWLCADGDLETRTADLLARLLALPPAALRGSKALFAERDSADLDRHLATEVQQAAACARTDDFVEAVEAQLGRRAPVFTGR